MLAILPFLIQWIALSQLGSREFFYRQSAAPQAKSHWSLLHELQQLPEEEIDHFLPQVCSMMLDREALGDEDLFEYFESVIEHKCAECFSFGTKVCGALKATEQPPSESLFRSLLSPTSTSQRNEERLRAFHERAEHATANGYDLPTGVSEHRSSYFKDYQFMLDTLARLGLELRAYPVDKRNGHLRHAISQWNALLYYRMASRGSISALKVSIQDIYSFPELTAENIATLCPAAAQYSLHVPLHQCNDRVMRILRFVESECEVLPSKERCPYLVTVEVLEQPFTYKSDLVYAQGLRPAAAVALRKDGQPGEITYGRQHRLPSTSRGTTLSQEKAPGPATSLQTHADDVQPKELTAVPDAYVHLPAAEPLRYSPRRRGSLLRRTLHSPRTDRCEPDGLSSLTVHSRGTQVRGRPLEDGGVVTQAVAEKLQDEQLEAELAQAYAVVDSAHQFAQTEVELDAEVEGSQALAPLPVVHANENVHIFSRTDTVESKTALGDKVANIGSDPSSVVDVELCEVGKDHVPTRPAAEGTHSSSSAGSAESIRGGSTNDPAYGASSTAGDARNRGRRSYRRPFRPRAVADTPERENRNPPRDAAPVERATTLRTVYPTPDQPQQQYAHPPLTYHHQQHRAAASAAAVPSHSQQLQQVHHHHQQLQSRRSYVRSKTWEERKAIVRSRSPFGHLQGWNMQSFIVKSGDDLRKEVLAMQLMEFCKKVFELEGLDIYLRPYQIVSTGAQAGLVEFLHGAESVDKIKKSLPKGMGLKQYFELTFGESYSFFYAKAVKNFVKSLVGYSLLTYVVQVKDRHNANILIDGEGHVLHIDYGYILGESPGFNINFESAPFKLTREYLDVLGGVDSEDFKLFQDLFLKGFLALQKHIEGLTSIIQLFYGDAKKAAAEGVRSRLFFPQSQADILALIGDSLDNWRTKQYDWYQERTNNIL